VAPNLPRALATLGLSRPLAGLFRLTNKGWATTHPQGPAAHAGKF